MSARYCAWIRIGGHLNRSSLAPFIQAVKAVHVALSWGEPPFEPTSAEDLLDAREEGRLWLCDNEAPYGEFDELEKTCRRLGLSYQRHCEASFGSDAKLVDWRPGMDKPVTRSCSNEYSDRVLIAADNVKKAIPLLEASQIQQALNLLRDLCRDILEVPVFEIA